MEKTLEKIVALANSNFISYYFVRSSQIVMFPV